MVTRDIAQLVALVTYSNMYIQGIKFDIEQYITDHCYNIEFVESSKPDIAGSTKVIAPDAHRWCRNIKEEGVKNVRLHWNVSSFESIPDHITAAFVGGGSSWFIETIYDEKSIYYIKQDKQSMKTSYTKWDSEKVTLRPSESVAEMRDQLDVILEKLIHFTSKFDYTKHWSENFTSYRETLHTFQPHDVDDYIPTGFYSKNARQLIEASFRSWVFGGMGSFNDLAFSGPDQDLYMSLSRELYETVCSSIVAAVNNI
jgi:hypothetical protein